MMTRKDTILIAAIVNTAILATLLITAIKTDANPDRLFSADGDRELPGRQELALDAESTAKPEVENVTSPITRDTQLKQEAERALEMHASLKQEEEARKIVASQVVTPEKKEVVVEKQNPIPVATAWVEIEVKKGDSLDRIARRYKTSIDKLIRENNLKSTLINVGQKLSVPNVYGTQTEKKEGLVQTQAVKPAEEVKYYTVKSGDSPWTIAVKNRMKVDDLLKLNKLNEEKARKLRPGDKLRIR